MYFEFEICEFHKNSIHNVINISRKNIDFSSNKKIIKAEYAWNRTWITLQAT